jgi:hypothetical protein
MDENKESQGKFTIGDEKVGDHGNNAFSPVAKSSGGQKLTLVPRAEAQRVHASRGMLAVIDLGDIYIPSYGAWVPKTLTPLSK